MDFLNGKIRPMYCKYLAAAFGSAMITSVYSIVDMAMVGQCHGPGNGGVAMLAVLAWGGLLVFQGPVLTFFGADASMLALAERYMEPIRYVFPLFLFNQMLSVFLRNDKNPGLATLGVLSGGCSTCLEITSSYSPATWGSTVRGLPRPSAPAFPFW